MSKRPYTRKHILFAAVIFLCLEALLFLFIDRPVAEAAKALDATAHGMINAFRSITDYAKGAWYLWPSGIAVLISATLLHLKRPYEKGQKIAGYIGPRALLLFVAVAGSGIAVNIIKPILGRARPLLWLRDGIYGFYPFSTGFLHNGMPSGHTTTAFAFAFVMAKLYPRGKIVWFFYAVMLALSRIAVNAHYASDVVFGAALAGLFVALLNQTGMNRVHEIIFPIDKNKKLD